MESEWHQNDEESDDDYRQRLASIPPLLPSELGQSLYTPPDTSEVYSDNEEEEEEEGRGLAWADHPQLLVPADPYRKSSSPSECVICLESLTEPLQVHRKGKPKSLHCRCVAASTLYHEVCLRNHLLRSNACPVCRAAPATTASAFHIPYHKLVSHTGRRL